MKNEKDKLHIQDTIEREFQKDKTRTKIIGFTPLGILQLTRKKTKVSLIRSPYRRNVLFVKEQEEYLSAETVAFRLERELVENRNSDFEAVLIETTKEVKEAILPHIRNGRRMDTYESVFFNQAIPPASLCDKTIWEVRSR